MDAAQLLRRLTPAVNAGARAAVPTLFESRGFEDLLAQALNGTVRSERDVRCACELQPPLDSSQLARLSAAADRAEAMGATRALMMIDGRGLEVDIAARAVMSELRAGDAGQLLHIDAAMVVGDEASATTNAQRRGLPFAGINSLSAAWLSLAADSGGSRLLDAPKSR